MIGSIKWHVGRVLDRSVGVAVALEDHRLALILVEEDFVLERAPVLGPHDLHGFFRQALPFLDLAGIEFDQCDSVYLVHCCSLSKVPGSTALGEEHLQPRVYPKVVFTFESTRASAFAAEMEMKALLGGTVLRKEIDGWRVSWESSDHYRHWCLQQRRGHPDRGIVVMKNPGSLSRDGVGLRRDTTLRILRRVGEAVRVDWLVLNLFDFAAPRLRDFHTNWHRRNAPGSVYTRIDLRKYDFVIFAHGDFQAQYRAEYLAWLRAPCASSSRDRGARMAGAGHQS